MLDESIRDRALGAVLGAAVGDALGASYEFLSAAEIAHQGGIEMRAGATPTAGQRRVDGRYRHEHCHFAGGCYLP
ncbi:MAG: ADP-ribosylglycohydrolase family protein [Lawsonella clevelandensis]